MTKLYPLPARARANPALYRATDADEEEVHPWSCWSDEREHAEAYTDDPGFGGPHIRSIDVELSSVLDIADDRRRRAFESLAEALGYSDASETADDWMLSGWLYPWEESSKVRRQLSEGGYEWLRYTDDYPEGAITLMRIGPTETRRYIKNASDLVSARRHRETFMDRASEKQKRVAWEWPKEMRFVGHCEAVMYASDKWKRAGNYEDYKHVAEGEQYVLIAPGFIRDYHSNKPMDMDGDDFVLTDMPEAFAELAEIFGVQLKTFGDEYLQIDIARAKLGGATNKQLGTFLFVYTASGVHMLIAGPELKIEKDGITG